MTNKRGPYRAFPQHTLSDSLVIAQTIRDEKAGNPMNRLLLAEAIGIKPSSSRYRDLLSSSAKYGLTEGTEKAIEVSLTDVGLIVTGSDAGRRQAGLRHAATTPKVFARFYEAYTNNKLPSDGMLQKVLVSDFGVPEVAADAVATVLVENGRSTGIIRDIGGSAYVLLDGASAPEIARVADEGTDEVEDDQVSAQASDVAASVDADLQGQSAGSITEFPNEPAKPKPIFLGHGKNRVPLETLQKQLATFQIPNRVAIDEPNLGRPIPVKVRETMEQCGSAILIFTRDERFFDADGNELWRPSENVVFELGAASYLYQDRVVILKERGVTFPTNFSSIGYIEFEGDAIEAKSMEVLQELIGFGLVKLTTG